ncbi:MAG: response regulator [Acidimicrobiia bacterium]|nr:response regulator [Acidimicrobiia bacterium]
MSVRVVVADDQALVRAGFVSLISATEDLTVVAEAADGHDAVAAAQAHHPDVVLMDVRMPRLDGLAATRAITEDGSLAGVRVVMVTTYELDEYVFEALRAGASGFVTKDVRADELRDAIRVVASGQALLSPSVTRRVVDAFAARPSMPTAPERLRALTDRERDVLELVGQGLSNEEVAGRLHMSPLTAKTHVSRILSKLGARDRAQLVVVAYETGLVAP